VSTFRAPLRTNTT